MLPETRKLFKYLDANPRKDWVTVGEDYVLTLTAKHTYIKIYITRGTQWHVDRVLNDVVSTCDRMAKKPESYDGLLRHHWDNDQHLVEKLLEQATKANASLYADDINFIIGKRSRKSVADDIGRQA